MKVTVPPVPPLLLPVHTVSNGSYHPVKGRSHCVEEQSSTNAPKAHATSQLSLLSHSRTSNACTWRRRPRVLLCRCKRSTSRTAGSFSSSGCTRLCPSACRRVSSRAFRKAPGAASSPQTSPRRPSRLTASCTSSTAASARRRPTTAQPVRCVLCLPAYRIARRPPRLYLAMAFPTQT